MNVEKIKAYLSRPENERPFAFYKEGLMAPNPAFSQEEVERLTEIVRLPGSVYTRNQTAKLLIDLSWASSRLEGNTYTQLETQVLIEHGVKHEGKDIEEAAMILNHGRAIDHMIASANSGVTRNLVFAIHDFLSDNSLAPDSRHFLDADRRGKIRTYTEDGLQILGSNYFPPQAEDRGVDYVSKEFSRLIESTNALPDPVNQSFFLMTRIPYLQPFYDANKRTSRISCNIPLLKNRLSPMSFVGFEKKEYIESMLAFYELGDEQLMKSAYVRAYIACALRFLPFSESARIEISEGVIEHIDVACNYVFTGKREENPVWILRQAPEMAWRERGRTPC